MTAAVIACGLTFEHPDAVVVQGDDKRKERSYFPKVAVSSGTLH